MVHIQNNYPQIIPCILCKTYSKCPIDITISLQNFLKKTWEEIFMALFQQKAFGYDSKREKKKRKMEYNEN